MRIAVSVDPEAGGRDVGWRKRAPLAKLEAGPRSVGPWTGAARATLAAVRVGRRLTADLELERGSSSKLVYRHSNVTIALPTVSVLD